MCKEAPKPLQKVAMKDAVCRLCLAGFDSDDCGYSIANDRFRKALEQVFTFKICFEEDDLPEYTCKQCSWNVLDFQSFSELVQTNQEKLQERSLLNDQNESIDGQQTTDIPDGIAYDEERSEGSASNGLEPWNTSSEGMGCASSDVEEVYKIHPDHDYSSKPVQDSDKLCPVMICEEYLITSNEIEPSSYSGNDKVLDGNEPPAKKRKIPSVCTSKNQNNNSDPPRSDSNNVPISSKMYPCEQCEKMFVSRWEVAYHKQEHTVTKCMFCKEYVSLTDFNLHMTNHLGDFCCNLCDKKFLNQRDFKCHKKACGLSE